MGVLLVNHADGTLATLPPTPVVVVDISCHQYQAQHKQQSSCLKGTELLIIIYR